MEQISSAWTGMSVQRRVIVAAATVAMFLAVLGVARLATRPGLELLYAGLENAAAGEVVEALEARGVAYEIRGNSIFVDTQRRDELRMTLASEGLPSNPTQGYEILDQMTGFGTTSQMFDAAYWRAKEGELARTIVSSPAINSARVHIANPGSKPFRRDSVATASVTITSAAGGVSAAHARALRYLVASAVPGLSPEQVSVIDANGGVILSSDESAAGQQRSGDLAAELKRNVERLLEARVGYGKAVVEVNVDTVTETEQITERLIQPDSRIAISQETVQSSSTDSDTDADVTVASNLPDGDAAKGPGSSQSQSKESRETLNFDVSETQREVLRSPGAVRRITTAVLVDGIRTPAADGTDTWAPRSDEEMAALRDLVAAAVGLDEARGDSLSLKTMEFQPFPVEGSLPGQGNRLLDFDAMRLAQIGILALAALLIGLFVVRPILTQKAAPALPPPDPDARATPGDALTGEIDPEDGPRDMGMFGTAGTAMMKPDFSGDDAAERPGDRLRRMIDERQEESMKILQSWMEDDGEKA